MIFEIIKVENGYVLVLPKEGIMGGFQKPTRYAFDSLDRTLAKVRSVVEVRV